MIRTTRIKSHTVDHRHLDRSYALFWGEMSAEGEPTVKNVIERLKPAAITVSGKKFYCVVRPDGVSPFAARPDDFTRMTFGRLEEAVLLRLALKVAALAGDPARCAYGVNCSGEVSDMRLGQVVDVTDFNVQKKGGGLVLAMAPRTMANAGGLTDKRSGVFWEPARKAIRYSRAANGALLCDPEGEWYDCDATAGRNGSAFVNFTAISHADEAAFLSSKTGALHWLFDRVIRPASDWLTLELALVPGATSRVVAGTIRQQYEELRQAVNETPVVVRDHTGNGLEARAVELLAVNGISAAPWTGDAPAELVIVHPREAHDALGVRDDYEQLKQLNPHSQMIASTHLFDEPPEWTADIKGLRKLGRDKRAKLAGTSLDVCAKEILIKRELAEGRLRLLRLPPGIAFIHLSGEPRVGSIMTAVSEREFNLDSIDERSFYRLTGHQRLLPDKGKGPFLFMWQAEGQKLWEICTTGLTALVDFMALGDKFGEVLSASGRVFTPADLAQVRRELPAGTDAALVESLDELISGGADYTGSELAEKFNGKKKAFHEALTAATGASLKPALRSKEAIEELLSGTVGIWQSDDRREYCAGVVTPDSVLPRACVVRRIEGADVEPWFIGLLEAYFIRHRNTTVVPFPFKYLREFEKMCGYGYDEDCAA